MERTAGAVEDILTGEPVFLSTEDLLDMVSQHGLGVFRDVGLLDSAALRPQATVFGEDAYPTLAGKAAALLHSIIRNHALVDGNKRLAWLAAVTFLRVNAHDVTMSSDAAYELVIDIAEGSVDDVETIAERLRVRPTR